MQSCITSSTKVLTFLSTSLSFFSTVLKCVALDLSPYPTSYDRNRLHKYPTTSVATEPPVLRHVVRSGHSVVPQLVTALLSAVSLKQCTFYYHRLFLCIWHYRELLLIITVRINHSRRSIIISFNYALRATTFQTLYPTIRDLSFRGNLFNSSRSIYCKRFSNQPNASITKISKFLKWEEGLLLKSFLFIPVLCYYFVAQYVNLLVFLLGSSSLFGL